MSYEGWWHDYDMSVIFPIQWEENGLSWMCDHEDNCSYYDDFTQEVCIDELGCYSPEEALAIYFATEEELAEWFGTFNFREEFMYEMAMEFRHMLAENNVHFETEEEFYAAFMPVFDQKWEEF